MCNTITKAFFFLMGERERERESFGREIGLTVEMKVHFIEGDFL
jgi:hypothetical protein